MQLSDIPSFFGLQSNRLFTIQTPMKGRSDLVLVDFQGTEGLSQNFEFHVRLASQDSNIELKKLIGQPVTITLQLTDALASSEERYFHGYVANFSHLDHDGSFTVYSATIVPWLWMLSRSRDIRIFQEENTEAILSKVFREYGKIASFEFRLSKATKNRSYCTQYRETDLEFVERLMQEDGLFFFFEHSKDDHKLVITDNSVAAKPIGGRSPVLQYTKGAALDNLAVITTFQASRQLESTHVGLKTFDYKVPHARRYVSGGTEVDQGDVPSYEVYDYLGEHGFPDSDRGEALTRFRTQALAAHSKIFIGTSTSRRLSPCRYFELDDHYDHDSTKPEDRQFLLTTVTHSGRNNYQAGEGAATYQCSFTCIRKKIPYRPAFTIERPSIIGPQTAVVVGPEGEEIYTDNLGRVKVQFHWDRLGKRDQGSSCWVRVGQPWAGRGFGMIQIPRIGDEVVVIFLDGNPDRPLIISSVYNAANMPPWDLPANATQSGILTRSTKTGNVNTANAIRFEDKKGSEEVWLHAEKDQRIEVEHDESHWVGNDRTKTIDRDETTQVHRNRTETVDGNETITIHQNRTERVDQNETISIGEDRQETVGGNETITIHGAKAETVFLAAAETIGLAKALTVGAGYQVTVGGAMNTTVGLAQLEQVGMSKRVDVGKTLTLHAGDKIELVVGDSRIVLTAEAIYLSARDIHLTANQTIRADAPQDVHLNSGSAQSAPSPTSALDASVDGGE
ncbi:type VI secretion system tip protein VgrG [Burkholderia dolosa]|uniref:type VI secretion system Vgr family protein n=1 Tax=Burkholderia dolosa TaxID=152500 RepID=UPI001B977F58|nr:type VI secretion system tip protein VgrG [Burkholderia dolosa]MBR8313422.1 type VI secretion system tip protein VgrG [Burkholderia dolosa]